MKNVNVIGTVIFVGETETVGANGFRKRTIAVDTGGEYPQQIGVEFVQDKVDVLDNYSEGQKVDIAVNIRGNEYNGRYYVNLQGWKINAVEGSSSSEDSPAPESKKGDDLPF